MANSRVEHFNTLYVDMENRKAHADCNCGNVIAIGFADSKRARDIAMNMAEILGGLHLKGR
jgi:hypothetical protein